MSNYEEERPRCRWRPRALRLSIALLLLFAVLPASELLRQLLRREVSSGGGGGGGGASELPQEEELLSLTTVATQRRSAELDLACVVPLVQELYPRLVPVLKDYCRLHQSIVQREPGVAQRYVVYKAWKKTGLGNRISSLTSAYLYAILAKRALLVEWGDEPKDIFATDAREEVFGVNFIYLFKSPGFAWETKGINISAPDARYDGHEDYFTCIPFDRDDRRLIVIESWDYFLPLISMNEYVRWALVEMFGEDLTSGLFRPLSHNLIRPLEHLQLEIDHFLETNPSFVGVQVRTNGYFAMNPVEHVLNGVADCVKRMQVDAGLDSDTKWFLFTDRSEVREYFVKTYGDQIIFYERGISRLSMQGIEGAVIDLFIAREAQQLLVSHGSTFGKVIYGMSGLPPYATTNEQQCTRKSDADLCYWNNVHIDVMPPYNWLYWRCLRQNITESPWKDRHDLNFLNGVRCDRY